MVIIPAESRALKRVTWLVLAAVLLVVSMPGFRQRNLQTAASVAGIRPSEVARACGSHALLIGEAGLLSAGFLLVGSGLLATMRPNGFPSALRICLAFPVGYGAVSFLLLGLLLVRLWFPVVLWIGLAIILCTSIHRLRFRMLRPPFSWPGMPSGVTIGVITSLVLFLPWLLGPELHTDAYEYHLAGPWSWLAAHGMAMRHVLPVVHFPMLAELPFAFPLMLGHDGVPKVLQMVWLLAGVAAIAAVLPAGEAMWGVLGLTVCASLSGIAGNCKNDGALTALVFMVYASLIATPQMHARSPGVLLAGLLCGFAISTKYLSAAHLCWPVLGILLVRKRWGWLAGVVGVAAITGAPWATKSFLLTGDPFFPMLSGHTPGIVGGWDARNAAVWSSWFGHRPPLAQDLIRYARYLVWENPAFVLLLGTALTGKGPRTLLVALSVFLSFVFFHAFPLPLSVQARRFFPILAPAVFLSFSTCAGRGTDRMLKCLAGGLVCLALVNRLPLQIQHNNPIPFALGLETGDALRAKTLGTFTETMDALRSTRMPTNQAVLSIGEIRSYLVPLPFLVGLPLFGGEAPLMWKLVSSSRNEQDLVKKLRQLDVGVILHNPTRAATMSPRFAPFAWNDRMLNLLESFFARRTVPILLPRHSDQRSGVYYVYRILGKPQQVEPAFLYTLPGADVLLASGQSSIASGNYAGAIGNLEPLCRRFRRIGQFHNVLAYAYRMAGRRELARSEYAIGLHRGMVDDLNVIDAAGVALESGHLDEAIQLFNRSIDVYPDLEGIALTFLHAARMAAIAMHLKNGKTREAEELISRALADSRPAVTLGRRIASDQLADLRAAHIVALDAAGHGAGAERELSAFRESFPLHAALSTSDLRRLVLSGKGLPAKGMR